MNTAFEKIHHYLKQKEIDLFAYQYYLKSLEDRYDVVAKSLMQRSFPLREFYDFLGQTVADSIPSKTLKPEPLKKIADYQLLEELGEGGMGVVYHAYHPTLQQSVAIKLIKPESKQSEKLLQRFLREMKILAKLDHPGIVQILNSGEENGHFYLVMEYVPGIPLDRKSASLSLREKIEILMMVLEALHYAHQRKIIHRDLKLGNILISETGYPKILDFGLAKEIAEDDVSLKLTQSGLIIGTLLYMAPEQLRGEIDHIDERSDLYSIGVCLYRLLSGQYPYTAPTLPELLRKIEQDPVTLLSKNNRNIHRDLDAILFKALEKNPEHRYQTAEAFAQDLRNFLQGLPIKASLPSWSEQIRTWSLYHRFPLKLAFFVLFLSLGIVAISHYFERKNRRQQFETHYQLARSHYEYSLQDKTIFEQKKNLLEALHAIHYALHEHQDITAETLKWEIGKALLKIAYQQQSYYWANYLIAELSQLDTISDASKQEIKQEFFQEREKETKKHQRRLAYWKQKLSEPTCSTSEVYDAIFDILKMSDPVIIQDVCQSIENGNRLILQQKEISETSSFRPYKTFLKVAKYWNKPEVLPFIHQGLQSLCEKLKPLKEEERNFEETDSLVLLFQALAPSASLTYAQEMRLTRWKMNTASLFSLRTEACYKKLLQRNIFQNEDISQMKSYIQGQIYEEQGQYFEAIQAFTRALQDEPLLIDAYNRRGLIKERMNDLEGSLADYTEAIRFDPLFAMAYNNRGIIKERMNDLQGALEDYSETIRLNPESIHSYFNRGGIKKKLNDIPGALNDFNEVICRYPQFFGAYYQRGHLKEKLNDFAGAFEDYTTAIHFNPQFTEAYNSRGQTQEKMQKFTEALEDYTTAISLNPQFANAYFNRGNIKLRINDLVGALGDYTEALRLKPEYPEAFFQRGILKIAQNNLMGAIADYTEALLLAPNYIEAYLERGNVKEKIQDLDGAIADYTEAIRINPQYAGAFHNRGFIKAQKNDLIGSLQDYTEAIRLNPQFVEAYYNRANRKLELNDITGAFADYTEAIRLNPQFSMAYFNRGVCHYRQQNLMESRKDFVQFLKGTKGDPDPQILQLREKIFSVFPALRQE